MISDLPESAADAYILHKIFRFPTDNGPRLAVALRAPDASTLLSFYSILVNSAVGQVWAIIIIIGVYASLRKPKETRTQNGMVTSVGVLNAKRPLDVGTLSVNYLYKLKWNSPWSLLIWLGVSIFALIASAGVPALVGRSMVLGHGAPVNPSSIRAFDDHYVSDNKSDDAFALRINSLEVPSALRAAGAVQLANRAAYSKNVEVDAPIRLEDRFDLGEGEYTSRYNYRYHITGKDFGLQHYNDLTLYVEGSCTTEYGWYAGTGSAINGSGILYDEYHLWNNTHEATVKTSVLNAPMPLAYFQYSSTPFTDDGVYFNASFAIIISSVQRQSYTQGTDPFYLTSPGNGSNEPFVVKNGRPILSCLQSDTWNYNNRNVSIALIGPSTTTPVKFPFALGKVFNRFLSMPKIVTLGSRLGASALLSATGSVGTYFDAGSASVHSDLTRLVLASYVSTKNTLSDLTLFLKDNTTELHVPNLLTQDELKDVAIFVLYSKDVSALSLKIIIAVPIVVVVMFILAYLITSHPWFPWYVVQDYQATVLYSLLDEHHGAKPDSQESDEKQGDRKWKRKGIAWFEGPRASGRHVSIVQGDDGRPKLVTADYRGDVETGNGNGVRNEGTVSSNKKREDTLEITAV